MFWKRSNERERRALAQEHKGEVVEGSGRVLEPRAVSAMVSVRFPPGHLERMRDEAMGQAKSLSAFVRDAVEHVLIGCPTPVAASTPLGASNGGFTCPHFSVANVSSFRCFVCARGSTEGPQPPKDAQEENTT